MSEAMKMVKAELGVDAMILSSKQTRRKGVMGMFGRPVVEITAGLDRPIQPRPNPYREREERELNTKEEFHNSMLGPIAREVKDLRDRVEILLRREADKPQAPEPEPEQRVESQREWEPARIQPPPWEVAEKPVAPTSIGAAELEELKKLLLKAVGKEQPALPPVQAEEDLDDFVDEPLQKAQAKGISPIAAIGETLREQGVEDDAVETLLDLIRPAAERGAKGAALKASLKEEMGKAVKCSGPLRLRKDGPKIIALVGPTGVGKTTTVAKLAAMYALEKGASVALVTIDNFRVGAVEQLKTYSRIMGVELESASTPRELEKALDKHRDKGLIIIDTVGRSPRDTEKLEELKGFFSGKHPVELHLCLAATTREREMKETVERFGVLPLKRILFTKLDESDSFGCMVNVHLRDDIPLSYFTTGQRVPEDIEMANARKLAELVLGETTR